MAVKTNDMILSYAVETSLGVLPTTPDWYGVDRTSISSFGSTISKEEIVPINKKAMSQKSIVTGYDSALGYSNNLTISALKAHIQGVMRANVQEQASAVPTTVTASNDAFAHAALSSAISEGALIYARNLTNSANNGLHVVDSASTTTLTITTSALVDETVAATNARFNVVGVQGDTGDIEINSDGNLTSTSLDFSSLGLSVGQSIWIGGSETITNFATSDYTGLVRIKVIDTNLLTIDDTPFTSTAADAGAAKTIQLFFGDFIKNVYRDDTEYNAESYSFEGKMPGMNDGTNYEYPNGNRVDSCNLSFDTRSKATVEWSFIGLDTPDMTSIRESGTWYNLPDNKAFGTSSDCVFIKVKDSDLVDYDSTFTNFSIEMSNSISATDALCTAAHVDLNDANFMVSGTINAFLNDPDMINAVKNNETNTISYAISNDDGVIDFYLPSITLDDKSYDMGDNSNIIVNSSYTAFEDDFYSMVMGISFYHYLPI